MYPTYLSRITSTAEKACVIAINHPKDLHARERLFDALAQVADSAFQGDDPELAHLKPLFGQAQVWAGIVRTRITGLRIDKRGHPAVQAIQYPVRDLLPILSDLRRELEMIPRG